MSKKGFTLVEILATIVLISLLLGLGVPGVMKISENMKKRAYNTKVDLIEQAGILWGQDNKTRLQSDDCDMDGTTPSNATNKYGRETKCYIIKIEDLIEDDYLEADNVKKINEGTPTETTKYEYFDTRDNTDIAEMCVWVYKKNNRVYAKYRIHCKGCATPECENNT